MSICILVWLSLCLSLCVCLFAYVCLCVRIFQIMRPINIILLLLKSFPLPDVKRFSVNYIPTIIIGFSFAFRKEDHFSWQWSVPAGVVGPAWRSPIRDVTPCQSRHDSCRRDQRRRPERWRPSIFTVRRSTGTGKQPDHKTCLFYTHELYTNPCFFPSIPHPTPFKKGVLFGRECRPPSAP